MSIPEKELLWNIIFDKSESDDNEDDDDEENEENDETKQKDIQQDAHVLEKLSVYSKFHGYNVCKVFKEAEVKVGFRVVKQNEDGKLEYKRRIGTVVEKKETGQVEVQWDKTEKKGSITSCHDQNELLLFDNSQTGVKHTYVQCNGCAERPIRGIRWKCLTCTKYDLCSNCYMSDTHEVSHTFKRITSKKSKGVQVTPRENLVSKAAFGILRDSFVRQRSQSTKEKYKVQNILVDIIWTYRSDAEVKLDDGFNTIKEYRVGRMGQCHLKFSKAAMGHWYYENHLPIVQNGNVQKGARVVRGPEWDINDNVDGGHGYVGTVTNIKNSTNNNVTVQWDNGETATYSCSSKNKTLRLFDNGPSGVKHKNNFCDCCPTDRSIRGIRWKCKHCAEFDLCNECYMSAKDDHSNHPFDRIIAPDLKDNDDDNMFIRSDSTNIRKLSYGIFKSAEVVAIDNDDEIGIVMKICNKADRSQCKVEVKSKNNSATSLMYRLLDLRFLYCQPFMYYHEHLPVLEKECRGYFDITYDGGSAKKFQVDILRNVQKERELTFKPTLYLIFAYEKTDNNMAALGEIIDFAKKTTLPCLDLGQRVMFYSGSTNTACIHYKTEKETIEKLVEEGYRKFERGDTDSKEDEIHYFIRMAEYVIGETVLPVIISLKNGGMTKKCLNSAATLLLPIIRFKKYSMYFKVLTPVKKENDCVKMTEYWADLKNPWIVNRSKPREYQTGQNDEHNVNEPDEITLLSDIPSNFRDNFDSIVCCLIIGASMEKKSLDNKIYGRYTDVYPNALSMYLLKIGKWRIPKERIKASFSRRSIEYIYEKDMTSEIKKGLFDHLTSLTCTAYTTPGYEEPDADLTVSTSQLYGLIFFALLQKKNYQGAKQLIETGCIRINHILIGCAILEDEATNWRTTPFLKEKLQRIKIAFTQSAIRITSCIYDADKKKEKNASKREKNASKRKRDKLKVYNDESKSQGHTELGDCINHAGRLLLNHGYLENAIKTENKTFLDNSTVMEVLNKMWYGTEQFDIKTIMCFIGLATFHMILLPLLMINMEARPLLWFYNKYKLPAMKVFIHMQGFLVLLTAYSYMLLFGYSEDRITYTDFFIIACMASFFVDESKQLIVAMVRRKWKCYAGSWWNRLDWLSMISYTSGMLLKLNEGSHYRNATKVLLVVTFILLCIRILNLFCISSILGPTLVMIQQMFRDTFSFLIIMTVIMMGYNISFYALLYPNSEFSWRQMENIIQNGYWMLFGELNLDRDKLIEPDCTFNKSIYENNILPRCPTQLGVNLTPYLKAFYGLIAVILMLNLLIAMYSNTFDKVHQESELHWSQLQTGFLEEYSIKTIFPIHLQLLVLPTTIVHAILWVCCFYPCGKLYKKCCGKKKAEKEEQTLNHRPMFVRVFLYNTNFDLELKTTREAEGNGALEAKGEMDLMEFDNITTTNKQQEIGDGFEELKKLISEQNTENEKRIKKISEENTTNEKRIKKISEQNTENEKRIKKMMREQQKMNDSLEEVKKLLSTFAAPEKRKDGTVSDSVPSDGHLIMKTRL